LATFREIGFQLGGLVAAEGSFTTGRQGTYQDGSERLRFVFQVKMATRDRPLLEALRSFVGFGSINDQPARRDGWLPESAFTINSRRGHHRATIPFGDAFLLPSNKREQYEAWKRAFTTYELAHPTATAREGRPARSRAAPSRSEAGVSAEGTTTVQPAGDRAAFIAGFVAGEGCFTRGEQRFVFSLGLGSSDAALCRSMPGWLGIGRVHVHPRRKPHYEDEITFQVSALRDLIEVVVPFMDEHLPPSYKREQYLAWRFDLLEYWETKAKRRRPCTVDGCEEPQRAKGRCRHHYYERYGQ